MQLVMVGLGRMGANIARRLKRNGIEVIVFDVNPNAIQTMAQEGFVGINDLAQIKSAVRSPRAVWFVATAAVAVAAAVQLAPTFAVTARTPLFTDVFLRSNTLDYDVLPDGRFVMLRPSAASQLIVITNWQSSVARSRAK